jgi:hypothetical protein
MSFITLSYLNFLLRYFYPSYIRAHHGAAIAGTDKVVKGARTATEADYIQKREFRLFCASLCFYAIALDAFHTIDGFVMELNRVNGHYKTAEGEDNDRRLSIAEWRKNYQTLSSSCFISLRECAAMADPDASFKMIDANGKGMILFSEFCAFIKEGEVRNKTDIGFILDFVQERDFVAGNGYATTGGGAKAK